MLQALLVERFKLEIRRDMKEHNVYTLMVGNGGAKLKLSERKTDNNSPRALGPDGKPRPMIMFAFAPGGAVTITAPSASLASLIGLMSRFTARPIVDITGIEGLYDFKLTFAAETNPGLNTSAPPGSDGAVTSAEPAPSVFGAVKQYGLRLEARKAAVEMLTVIHLEKIPTEN